MFEFDRRVVSAEALFMTLAVGCGGGSGGGGDGANENNPGDGIQSYGYSIVVQSVGSLPVCDATTLGRP